MERSGSLPVDANRLIHGTTGQLHTSVWSVAALLLSVSVIGCSTMHLPDYVPRSGGSYRNAETNGLLTVAVEPMTDQATVEKYFGTDLLTKGILPVLVLAENRSPSTSFMVSENLVALGTLARQRDAGASSDAGSAMATTGVAGVLFVPLIAAPVLPVLIIGGAQMISDSAEVKHNFAEKALRATTLSPGERTHGFVYFDLPEEFHRQSNLSVQVKISEMGSGEMRIFDFPFRWDGV